MWTRKTLDFDSSAENTNLRKKCHKANKCTYQRREKLYLACLLVNKL